MGFILASIMCTSVLFMTNKSSKTTSAKASASKKVAVAPKKKATVASNPKVEAKVASIKTAPKNENVVIRVNDVKNKKTRRRMLGWFRKSK
jgi:hypothetical protein